MAVEGEVGFGPGSFDLTEGAVGLANLAGYTANLKLSFTGTQDGQAQEWSKTYVMLSAQEPAARLLTVEKSGDNPDPEAVLMAEKAGAAYERRGSQACTATVIEQGSSLADLWEPAGFLPGVIGAQAAGSDTVNGTAADHYTFDERALGLLGIATATGEMWVATNDGYIAKYALTTTGDENYFGEGTAGTLTLEYDLTEPNQPAAIQLPKDCPSGLVDAPLLPDASNVENLPGLLSFDSSSSVADAAAFYQQQMPDLGWTLAGEPTTSETTALLDFAKGSDLMTVIITGGEAGTRLRILLESP